MALTGAATNERLHEEIFEKNVSALEPLDQETYSLIAIQAESKMRMRTFGFHRKTDKTESVLGLYIVVDGMAERFKKAGVASCAHEWLRWACAGYYLQMSKVTGDTFRNNVTSDDGENGHIRGLGGTGGGEASDVYEDFYGLGGWGVVSPARAALRQIDLAAELPDCGRNILRRYRWTTQPRF